MAPLSAIYNNERDPLASPCALPRTSPMPQPGFRRILLPTDLGDDARFLLAHGLVLARRSGAELVLAHAQAPEHAERPWNLRPLAVELLVEWGLLPDRQSAPQDAGVTITQLTAAGLDRVDGVLAAVGDAAGDLLIVGTERRHGLERALQPSVAEKAALRFRGPTLFVGDHTRPIFNGDTGALTVARVLVPVGPGPEGQDGLDGAAFALDALGLSDTIIDLLFVADEAVPYPHVVLPEDRPVHWCRREGAVIDGILGEAKDRGSDLIVMGTRGHDGLLDALRGSRTERVMREALCPVLAVPSSS
jgi:nucleotide-binding universal stress UspA family protein